MKYKVAQKTQLYARALISSSTTVQILHGLIVRNSLIAIICADFIPSEDVSNVLRVHVIFLTSFTTVRLGIYIDLLNIYLPFGTSLIAWLFIFD